ncbi:MAG: glycoside hydrolase family 15 protein, partial [Myxococcaceae bacterium]
NWDYRFCWVRDATLTLIALLDAGYQSEAAAWRDWLLRAVAGEPDELQIMYGVAGERRLTELELPWLTGYESSRPVRIGNAASQQLQLDIYGEVMDCFHQARLFGLDPAKDAWRLQKHFMDWLESHWQEPDEGIWEVRGPRRHFTHSKVMAWVALDRAIASATQFGLDGPVDRWSALRDEIHRQVCEKGYNAQKNAFTQSYGDPQLDASLLMIPLVGFLPPTDPRVTGTVEAVRRELVYDGFVYRYDSRSAPDGLPPGEGVFLPCSFWLADCYSLLGRHQDAERLFRKLLALRNDVGLLSEEYDVRGKRMVGNFPQAFSHLSIVGCAQNLASARGKHHHRRAHSSALPSDPLEAAHHA